MNNNYHHLVAELKLLKYDYYSNIQNHLLLKFLIKKNLVII